MRHTVRTPIYKHRSTGRAQEIQQYIFITDAKLVLNSINKMLFQSDIKSTKKKLDKMIDLEQLLRESCFERPLHFIRLKHS